jgi:hypothetical protein
MNNKQRIQRRRIIATFMVIAYMVPDLLPGFVSIAAPQVFVHPGAGVSSLPLNVSSFNAAGFGDLADGVNLANGNVFLGTDNLSYNSKPSSGDETTNTIGGSGWNLTQRMRLNGFSKTSNTSFGLDNLATESNPGSSYYNPYYVKPNVLPINRMLNQDSPSLAGICGNGYASGVYHEDTTPLAVGKYRLSLDARADAPLSIYYGLDSYNHYTSAIINTGWQVLSTDYTIAATDPIKNRYLYTFESVANNSAWEMANVKLQALDVNNNPTGANLLTSQDFNSSYYPGVCAKPVIETAYRMQSADNLVAPLYYSGIYHIETPLPAAGRYRVSLDARTRNGTLNVFFGSNDVQKISQILTTTWQSLSVEYNVAAYGQDRFIEVLENT